MAPDLNWELRLGFLVHDVSRLRRRVVDKALKPLGVTRSQWWVLAFLSRSDGMSQVALADELDLGKQQEAKQRAMFATVAGEAWARTGQSKKALETLEIGRAHV